jgi:hypothetical protein
MIMRAAAGVVALLILTALIFIGVVYLGTAIDMALINALGVPGAAALTAFILLIGPVIWCLSVLLRRPPPKPPGRALGEEALGILMGTFAKDTSIIAMVGAGLFGIAEAYFRNRRNRNNEKKK